MNSIYDVFIVGGGPGGMMSAMTLARGRRQIFLCDDEQPRNAPARQMQNFPSRDGIPPLEFLRLFRSDLEKYDTIHRTKDSVLEIKRAGAGFKSYLKSGAEVHSRKIILATGVKDELPAIPGIADLWGKSVFHCPYCHGFEHRDEAIGLLVNEEKLYYAIPLILGISKDLILFTDGKYKFTKEQIQLIRKNNIMYFEEKIVSLKRSGDQLTGVELEDGSVIPRKVLFLRPVMRPKSDLGQKLGCQLNEFGLYEVDSTGRSTEKDIFVAGDLNDIRQSVLIAAAFGAKTAIAVNLELLTEDFHQGR